MNRSGAFLWNSGISDGFLQPAVDGHAHGQIAGKTSDHIGNGFGQENAGYTEAHPGQQQRQRGDYDGFAQQGEENGVFRVTTV